MHAAYDSESVFRPAAGVADWIAPVGHDRAQSSQAVQRLKSMTGNPNDARVAERIRLGQDSRSSGSS